MRRSIFAFLCIFSSLSQAAIIDMDGAILDTSTGFKWRDLGASVFAGYDEIVAEVSDETSEIFGYRIATKAEVEHLLYITFDLATPTETAKKTRSFLHHFDSLASSMGCSPLEALADDSDETIRAHAKDYPGYCTYASGGYFSSGSATISYSYLYDGFEFEDMGEHSLTATTDITWVKPGSEVGWYLVKDFSAIIPEPSLGFIFSLGLIGLVISQKSQGKYSARETKKALQQS